MGNNSLGVKQMRTQPLLSAMHSRPLTDEWQRINHSSATLTEVFPCFFLSCKANARVKLAKMGHGPHSYKSVVNCVVLLLFALFCILFVCKCVLYYCHQVSTQLQLTNILYHITNTSTVILSNYLLRLPWFSDMLWSKQPYFLPASDPYRWCPTRHPLLSLPNYFHLEVLHEQSRKTWKHKHKKYSMTWPRHICNCQCSFCLEETGKTIHFLSRKALSERFCSKVCISSVALKTLSQ